MNRLIHTLTATRKRKVALIAVAAVTATTAYAAWLVDGEGEGTAKIGTLAPLTVEAGTASGSSCFAGTTCDGTFRVTNPNPVDLVLTGVVPSLPKTGTSSANFSDCPFSNLSTNTVTGLSIAVPKSATTDVTVPGAFRLASTAPNLCAGATLTLKSRLTFSTPTS